MEKNELINEIISTLIPYLDSEQLELVKSAFYVKMQGYEVLEIETLPSTKVRNDSYILQRFVIDMTAKGLKQSSVQRYLYLLRPFLKKTGKSIVEITSQDIIDYIAIKKLQINAHGRPSSQNYICHINKIMFIFFDWAYKKHHIDADIMREVDRIQGKQKRKEKLSIEEIEACRDNVKDDRESALLELMLSTGMRVGEIAALEIGDINFAERSIVIPEGKSESAERTVYLTVKAKNAMTRYLNGRTNGFFLQPQRRQASGKMIKNETIEKIAKSIGARGNCHCSTTVHVFRKTFASEEYKRTKDVKYVSILLGHSSTAVTEKFYLVDDLQDVAYQALYRSL